MPARPAGAAHSEEHAIGCPTCGLVQLAPRVPPRHVARCAFCGRAILRGPPRHRGPTLVLALGAAILFVPANTYPVIRTTIWGRTRGTTILEGVREMVEAGSLVVGALLFITAILVPAFEILGYAFLSAGPRVRSRGRAWTLRALELAAPWSMLGIFLISILIGLAQLGLIARVEAGPGLFAFAAVVALLLVARTTFDRRFLWGPAERPP